jgi:Asp-tRNA(Asn)/Glu-tRNA(Gln) amidotransferase A subunit family amidase
MTDTPWLGDACSLVEEFRAGRRSPREEMQATLNAVKNSKLNAVSFIDEEGALERASRADISLPFGGIPMGVKELDNVNGWPATEASVPFADRKATYTGTMVTRLIERGGATHFGLTTASEFGGVNVTRTVLNGVTRLSLIHI